MLGSNRERSLKVKIITKLLMTTICCLIILGGCVSNIDGKSKKEGPLLEDSETAVSKKTNIDPERKSIFAFTPNMVEHVPPEVISAARDGLVEWQETAPLILMRLLGPNRGGEIQEVRNGRSIERRNFNQ